MFSGQVGMHGQDAGDLRDFCLRTKYDGNNKDIIGKREGEYGGEERWQDG
jgi:hypothetical protein